MSPQPDRPDDDGEPGLAEQAAAAQDATRSAGWASALVAGFAWLVLLLHLAGRFELELVYMALAAGLALAATTVALACFSARRRLVSHPAQREPLDPRFVPAPDDDDEASDDSRDEEP